MSNGDDSLSEARVATRPGADLNPTFIIPITKPEKRWRKTNPFGFYHVVGSYSSASQSMVRIAMSPVRLSMPGRKPLMAGVTVLVKGTMARGTTTDAKGTVRPVGSG